jgi:hypothetical protein
MKAYGIIQHTQRRFDVESSPVDQPCAIQIEIGQHQVRRATRHCRPCGAIFLENEMTARISPVRAKIAAALGPLVGLRSIAAGTAQEVICPFVGQ